MYKGEGNDTYYIGGADRHIVPDFFRSGTGHAQVQSQKGPCGSPGKESQQNSGGIPLYIEAGRCYIRGTGTGEHNVRQGCSLCGEPQELL